MKNILFITWDGPETSYMEGLFMPIFHEIMKEGNFKFHVIQFTWASASKIDEVKKTAKELDIVYTTLPVFRKPHILLGSLYTLFSSVKIIKKYIRDNNIQVVMPRSTFPAFIVNRIKNSNFMIIFDADGLPIEERVDFAVLKKDSLHYRWLKYIETEMLLKADKILTRSQKAIEIHLQNIGGKYRDKFHKVSNGRNADFFKPNDIIKQERRKTLGVSEKELLFIYCGSLGGKYCWDEMIAIFEDSLETGPAKFLVLTGNPDYAHTNLPKKLMDLVIINKVQFAEVPQYLCAADIAFAIISPTYSMQAASATKLGEYLLMNIPTIASKGIGDTEEILKSFNDCFLYDHTLDPAIQQKEIRTWLEQLKYKASINTRREALNHFSLPAAAASYQNVLSQM